ncbi:RIP metalloprotease RseP [Streptococcus dentapri]|uniref:Zinc metalloprotease n=1 Tax=Streptococcus dentapri TaxID=573564 RepID=A0ABV8D358_9STRE
MLLNIIVFIIVFGILVVVHEFGHFYFAKKSGILVREFAIGMGPKIFAHTGKDGTAYTIRILPLGGYVRMAGWGDDTTEIKTGSPASLTLNDEGVVTRINLSGKQLDSNSLPINITSYDLEDKLSLTGVVLDKTTTYKVDHDATIVEEDGTELRIAPLDVQYQNASVLGKMITNFAGPMNNFILGTLVLVLLVFLQGGVPNENSNAVRVTDNGAAQVAGVKNGDKILAVEDRKITNWEDLTEAVSSSTKGLKKGESISLTIKNTKGSTRKVEVIPQKTNGSYLIGVQPTLKTSFWAKLTGGFKQAFLAMTALIKALGNLVTNFSLNKLGGPVAMYQMVGQASQSGFTNVLYLMGMLSMNLGVVNLFPIPVLDGGKIVINIIEALRRKPLKQETETYITLVGVVFMLLLMVAVTWNDIMRAFF